MNTIINQSILNQNSSLNHGSHKAIPSWIVWVQCSCFAVLYSIWYYPQTNFLSDLCMVIGAVLSLYVLFLNRSFFSAKESIPFWMLVALFGWIIFHLLFLSNNYPLQLREFTNIWKRVAIAIIFGLGFGIALANSVPKKGYWVIFYLGMMMPSITYLIKYKLNIYAPIYGFIVPEYFKFYLNADSIFYIHKVYISTFNLPFLAICIAQLNYNLSKDSILKFSNIFYILGIFVVLMVLTVANSKNGIAYASILILYFILIKIFTEIKNTLNKDSNLTYFNILILIICLVLIVVFLIIHIERNPSWNSLLADSMVAIQVDKIDSWKYWGEKNYPLNEYGITVTSTNYERVAFGVVALKLIIENPNGYGLVENSFGYLTKMKWSDSKLSQCHSGWLDLMLGIGIPGIILILITLVLILYNLKNKALINFYSKNSPWNSIALWVLSSFALLWLTTEISLKIPLIVLVFWISFAIGITKINSSDKVKSSNYLK